MGCVELRKFRNISRKKLLALNNKGSALLTVILVVSFLTILATTLLYISAMNAQIKQADYHNKQNFYVGEQDLEYIRAVLMEDVSKASVLAYQDMSMNYIAAPDASLRELQYNNFFITRLQEVWDDKLASNGGYWDTLMASYASTGTVTMSLDNDASGDGHLSSSEALALDVNNGTAIIKGVKVQYTNPQNKITTIISTDFKVSAPPIDWSAEGSYTVLQSGHDATYAATKTLVTPVDSVIYTNWKKE